jgi:hypothetical protein
MIYDIDEETLIQERWIYSKYICDFILATCSRIVLKRPIMKYQLPVKYQRHHRVVDLTM